MGIDYFLVASLKAKKVDFIMASSVGNDSLFLVYFLIFPLRLDLQQKDGQFLVYGIYFLNSKNFF